MSTLRMEPQFMMLGHAAGTASYVTIQSDENVMPVQKIDLNRLNKLLLKENMILNNFNIYIYICNTVYTVFVIILELLLLLLF